MHEAGKKCREGGSLHVVNQRLFVKEAMSV